MSLFSTSLLNLPAFSFADAEEISAVNSQTNKLEKGYKLFHEEYIHNYQARYIYQSASTALAARMIRGSTKQTAAMKRGLQMESEVLANYAEMLSVNVLPVGFIIRPDTSYLGATPDGRVYDPSESPPFGLVEVKSSMKNDVFQVAHLKVQDGHASLRRSHAYYWQVQGQLAITGLEWCDFVTDTLTTITVERV